MGDEDQGHCAAGAQVLCLDRRVDSVVAVDVPADVDLEDGVRRVRADHRAPQVLLSFCAMARMKRSGGARRPGCMRHRVRRSWSTELSGDTLPQFLFPVRSLWPDHRILNELIFFQNSVRESASAETRGSVDRMWHGVLGLFGMKPARQPWKK